jgi:D-beta-D-heptose 7-phosphate kinase / D-beta-D-heptose 1-phosphate adenosyltransferase
VIGTTELERILTGLGRPRVLIVGDLIMDRYVLGEVGRISPEAPIPVLSARSAELRLGGAGNVAANLRAMEAAVQVIGVIGDDGRGKSLREMLEADGVDASAVIVDPTRPTIEKTRMISGVQQMLRVDWEDSSEIHGETTAAVLAKIPSAIQAADAVVLSDYGKGICVPEVLRAVIDQAKEAGIPVLVDPKGTEYERYSGATVITPNKKEAETAVGRKIQSDEDLERTAKELIEVAALDSIIITLGADGIYYRSKQGVEGRVPTQARAVYDVTGAGDTVVAHLALHLAAGLDLEQGITLANCAAGIVVGRLGTNSVTRGEVSARLAESLPQQGKVLEDSSLDAVLETWTREGKRVVFTNGCFDVLHVGHVDYLRFARAHGDVLIVGVNSDASVKRLKGESRPVNPLGDRMAVLAALEMVDAVVSFDEDTPKNIIERVTPNVLVKGEDWKDKGVVGREWVESHGGQVVLAPLVPGRSTTSLLERARQSDLAAETEQ